MDKLPPPPCNNQSLSQGRILNEMFSTKIAGKDTYVPKIQTKTCLPRTHQCQLLFTRRDQDHRRCSIYFTTWKATAHALSGTTIAQRLFLSMQILSNDCTSKVKKIAVWYIGYIETHSCATWWVWWLACFFCVSSVVHIRCYSWNMFCI